MANDFTDRARKQRASNGKAGHDGSRRTYRRRSAEDRIAELEDRIAELRARKKAQEARTSPVLQDIPKVQKRLRKLAQLAMDHQRPDIANSVTAFVTTLERFAEPRDENARVRSSES